MAESNITWLRIISGLLVTSSFTKYVISNDITWLRIGLLVTSSLPSMLFVMICGKYETHELKKAPRCALLWRLPNLMGIKMFC